MRTFLLICLSLISYSLSAQVKLLTLDELDKRIAAGKDTTYVVNFWATWCAPCVAELPNFEKLRVANLKKPVKVLLISVDFKSKLQKEVIPFVVKNQIKAEVFLLNETDQQKYIERVDPKWTGAIPATLFVKQKTRRFYEQDFTEKQLKSTLLNLK
ncbi:TlpA family protein disulfide reductase [Pedobacter sp. HDW13]|uniref:TlpA disulfide reductase family protein n=1 Tax=unclassified Pedobacter TaxID=2628915 RepID=UPI000F59F584|nr:MULTISPECIES: TlpA disulfide reductase family protein [unclassified Pedobacter]QIL41859.1 TlpA family protein disulfide reductase [Pedobacter sp. HDW13]RQO68411.1 redoxin [Pedobacter sp. KBW01]